MTGNLPSTHQAHPGPIYDRAFLRAAIHPDHLNPIDHELLFRASQGIRLRGWDVESCLARLYAFPELPEAHIEAA